MKKLNAITLFINNKLKSMSYMETLLNSDVSNEVKCGAVDNIIRIYELPLSADKILLAFTKILVWLNKNGEAHQEIRKNNRLLLFDKILTINKDMYTAIILALCDVFHPKYLCDFIILERNVKAIDIGLSQNDGSYLRARAVENYCKLLNYYEFDVSNILEISSTNKQLIQDYRAEKYAGKTIKHAIKK